jgi:hypothetical protein
MCSDVARTSEKESPDFSHGENVNTRSSIRIRNMKHYIHVFISNMCGFIHLIMKGPQKTEFDGKLAIF